MYHNLLIIEEAIEQKKELSIKFYTPWEGSTGEIIHPLLSSTDVYGFPFIWAYVPEGNCYYKYYADMITEAVKTGHSFSTENYISYPDF